MQNVLHVCKAQRLQHIPAVSRKEIVPARSGLSPHMFQQVRFTPLQGDVSAAAFVIATQINETDDVLVTAQPLQQVTLAGECLAYGWLLKCVVIEELNGDWPHAVLKINGLNHCAHIADVGVQFGSTTKRPAMDTHTLPLLRRG